MHSPSLGTLHMLFPLNGMLFPKVFVAFTLSLQIFAQKKSPLQKGLPWTPFCQFQCFHPRKTHDLSLLYYFFP